MMLQLLLVAAVALCGMPTAQAEKTYKMCVPEPAFKSCEEMASEPTSSGVQISCIAGRDRIECLDRILERKADFGAVDPEDMYVAFHLPNEDFKVFQEIRSKDEPAAEFRYEGVAVVHKDLPITNITGIKGLKSCHTGVGRNVGYKIPLTKLMKMGIVGQLNDLTISPRENELKALSQLFKKACIVGKWAPDPQINARLKSTYSNLCALCEHPDICDYPDLYSGYDGALRCLAHNGGEIAWTKVIFVKKFFGLPVGVLPATPSSEDHTQYSYLCPDATKRPIDGPPCAWAARPWQGYLGNADLAATVGALRDKLKQLNVIGDKPEQPEWFASVLLLNNKTLIADTDAIGAKEYLDKAKYTDVIERDAGPPRRSIRFCVTSEDELDKCRTLRRVSFSRDIRPAFDCVLEENVRDCLKTVSENGADVISLDAGILSEAEREFNLKPILAEQYGALGGSYYAVAIVKKGSSYQSLADLKGARSCHTGFGRSTGWNAPVYALLKAGLIKRDSCPIAEAVGKFFSGGSCVPGALQDNNNPTGKNPTSLCANCGDPTSCKSDSTEKYSGYSGAFRCLVEDKGDVAFAKHATVPANTDGKNTDEWAKDLKSADFELLCPNGGRVPVDQYVNCNLLQVAPHMVVTSNSKSDNDIDAIRHGILEAANLFGKRSDVFKLFGPFNGHQNLLFKDSATGLLSTDGTGAVETEYMKMLEDIRSCDNKQ